MDELDMNHTRDRRSNDARIIAKYLKEHPLIKQVYYPGLESYPGHETARKQMRDFGGMLSFELDDIKVDQQQFLKKLKMIRPALSLGSVETIVCAPVATSHEKMTAAERADLDITDALLRLSVGIEDREDIIADIEQAL